MAFLYEKRTAELERFIGKLQFRIKKFSQCHDSSVYIAG